MLRLFRELGVRTQDVRHVVRRELRGLRPGVRRRARTGGLLPTPRSARRGPRTCACSPRSALPPARPAGVRGPVGRPPDDPQFIDEGGYSAYFCDHFLLPLTGAIWSSSPAGMRGVPGPLPVPLLRKPRHADRQALADLAHRLRRQPDLRAADRRPARRRRAAPATPVEPVRRRPDGVEVPTATATRVRPGGDRHPPRPGACACWTTPTDDERRAAGRLPLLTQRHRAAHRRARCCPAPPAPAPPGTTCSTPARRASRRRTSPTT